jgi:cell fate (sporulation/competence/biofilm development) regulator YlbF (YheA/YmcA/DUF963 family)
MEDFTLTPDMITATESLGMTLRQAEPVVLYHLARETLEASPEATEVLKRLSEAQAAVRTRQTRGEVTPEDMARLRALQREVQTNPVIRQYAQTQQAALGYLREVNREISELLGTDFGALAKKPGCC